MYVAQSSYAPARPLAGLVSAARLVVNGTVAVLGEHARALRAAETAALHRRRIAALRALYCGRRRPFS